MIFDNCEDEVKDHKK